MSDPFNNPATRSGTSSNNSYYGSSGHIDDNRPYDPSDYEPVPGPGIHWGGCLTWLLGLLFLAGMLAVSGSTILVMVRHSDPNIGQFVFDNYLLIYGVSLVLALCLTGLHRLVYGSKR